MPIINAQIATGRTSEQKRALIEQIADAVIRVLDVPEASIRVLITEIPPEHWGVGKITKAERDRG